MGGRNKREDIHWLLYPHIPLVSHYSSEEIRNIVDKIVQETLVRKSEIENRIAKLDDILKQEGEGMILE